MNLLIINLDKNIFDPNSTSLARLKEYSQLVENIFVIVWTKGKEQPIVFQNKLFIFPTNSCCRLFYYWDSLLLARKVFKEKKIDLIFTQDPFETGLAGWIISKIKKIPLQLQVHTDFLSPYFWQESWLNKIRVLLAKFLIPQAKTLRVVSERIKKSIISVFSYPDFRIFVLPIFVDIESIQNTESVIDLHKKYSNFKFIILMASRLNKEKNIGLGIKALSKVIGSFPQTGLIIVGSGPEEKKLKSLVETVGLSKNVKFEPWTINIFSYYKTTDLFLLTSNYEGFGLAVVEAAAAGCPILMTDVGCAGEIISDGQNGLVRRVGDEIGVVSAIEKIFTETELYEKIKNGARQTVKQLSSKKQYLQSYFASWQQTIIK